MLRDYNTYDWFTISLVIVALGFILLKQINVLKYNKFIQLGYSKAYFKVKFKETSYITGFEVAVTLVSNLILSQILYLLLDKTAIPQIISIHPIAHILIIFVILSVFFLVKYYIETIINFCFTNDQLIKTYVFYKQIVWSYAVFLGLPLLIFYIYNSADEIYIFYGSLCITGIFYVINIAHFAYKNRRQVIGNWYYLILYLCALEIAPYYFLYKMIAIE